MAANVYIQRQWTAEEVRRIGRVIADGAGDKARKLPYQVSIDGLKIIRRTTDPKEFTRKLDWMQPGEGNKLEIQIFRGRSTSGDVFVLSAPEALQAPPNGAEHDLRTELLLERQSRDHERELSQNQLDLRDCRRDLKLLQKEHEELSRYTDEIETELKTLREQKPGLSGLPLGEIGSVMIERFLQRNAALPARPGLQGPPATAEDSGLMIEPESEPVPVVWQETVATVLSLEATQASSLLYITQFLAVEPAAIPAVITLLNQNQNP